MAGCGAICEAVKSMLRETDKTSKGPTSNALLLPVEAWLVFEAGHQQLQLNTSNSFEAELGT